MRWPRWFRREPREANEVREARAELAGLLAEARRITDQIMRDTTKRARHHG